MIRHQVTRAGFGLSLLARVWLAGCAVGAKESGYGFHSSKEGHRQFAQVRVVSSPKK